eukprot:4866576-Heterocapsa_arctica.AAC.1
MAAPGWQQLLGPPRPGVFAPPVLRCAPRDAGGCGHNPAQPAARARGGKSRSPSSRSVPREGRAACC